MGRIYTLSSLLFFFAPKPAYAASVIPTDPWNACLAPGTDVATLRCIPIVLQNIINFLILFAGIVCVFLIIYAGYRLVTSEGDPEKISMARKTIFYGIGGMLLVLISFLLLNIIATFTGVTSIAPRR